MATREIVALNATADLLDSPQAGDTYLAKVAAHFEAAITTDSTIDGRDVATDGAALDAVVIAAAATDVVALAALPKAGGQITGNVTCAAAETFDGRDLSVDGTKLDWLTVTQAVDLDAMEARQLALATAFVWGGTWDASAGPFPTSTVAGEVWRVTVGGTVDSVIFNVGDMIVALVNSASIAVYAANWIKIDNTDAVTSVNGNIGAVVLDADDFAEGTNLFLTAAERAKLGFLTITQAVDADAVETAANASKVITDWITVTQAVNLDTIETDTAANKVKADWITVTQAVNLDTIETDVAASKVKTDWLTVTQAVDLDAMEISVAANVAQLATDVWSPAYGCLECQAGAVAEATVDATPRDIAGWNTDGLSSNTTPSHALDSIEVDVDGTYKCIITASFSGTASKTYQLSLYKNAVDTGYAVDRKLGTGGDVGSCSFHGILALLDDDILTIRQSTSDGGSAFTLTEAAFSVEKIGP